MEIKESGYREPIDVNAEGVSTLKFRTMDNAGNIKLRHHIQLN